MDENIKHGVICSLDWIQEELEKLQGLAALFRDRRRGLPVQGCEGIAGQLEGTCQVLEQVNEELECAFRHLEPDAPEPSDGERILAFPGGPSA